MDEELDDSVLLSDDLLPSDGSMLRPSVNPELERRFNDEKAKAQAAGPMIELIISWFDDQIAALDSIDNVRLSGPGLTAAEQIHGLKWAKTQLERSRMQLKSLQNAYVKN